MFGDYVYEQSAANWDHKLLIEDYSGIGFAASCTDVFLRNGFHIIPYLDDLSFRLNSYDELLDQDKKIVVLLEERKYVPYDVSRRLHCYQLSFEKLFPKLNSDALRDQKSLDLNLLSEAYVKNYEDQRSKSRTEDFLSKKVYVADNAINVVRESYAQLLSLAKRGCNYKDWMKIAEGKARIDILSCQYQLDFDSSELNRIFETFVIQNFGKLSGEIDWHTPVLVSKAMDYMSAKSKKFALVVMDGMSEFDWDVLSESFEGIHYSRSAAMAMVPTITSVSRQCLVAGKYPRELINPWKQEKEKQEFTQCVKNLGYKDQQIQYGRGYDFEPETFSKCCCVIINDCDDMVHGQKQGMPGMYQDMKLLAGQGKLAELTRRLIRKGFDVYISADHGNTECIGAGLLKGTGVETETKSHRMIVLKDYANQDQLKEKYSLIEFPKYYLNKELNYLICECGESLDAKGMRVMSHGGITLDEVVVPFIEIKAGENNG
ncbi:PglZ domain-containing protein [Lactimicrobium massiliense]|uniref:PglZ domain-containing protein n=1 Tax=Lactimicrobium massiliense TaxID=2161814 RepID=UPI000D554AB2|nr:PglZ domain-containing protein [Lactimicrobium massiliense]